jgi:hypothetical protein
VENTRVLRNLGRAIKFQKKRDKRREALGNSDKRLLYCVNVNRTSLDHLLLGESADIDEMSHGSSIQPDERSMASICFGDESAPKEFVAV